MLYSLSRMWHFSFSSWLWQHHTKGNFSPRTEINLHKCIIIKMVPWWDQMDFLSNVSQNSGGAMGCRTLCWGALVATVHAGQKVLCCFAWSLPRLVIHPKCSNHFKSDRTLNELVSRCGLTRLARWNTFKILDLFYVSVWLQPMERVWKREAKRLKAPFPCKIWC